MKKVLSFLLLFVSVIAFAGVIKETKQGTGIEIWTNPSGTMTQTGYIDPINGLSGSGIVAKQYAINGDFDLWQRMPTVNYFKTNSSNTALYTADRWVATALYPGNSATQTITKETSNVPTGSVTSLKAVVSDNVPTTPSRMRISHTFEDSVSRGLTGKVMTLSYYAKAIQNIDRISAVFNYATAGGIAHDGTAIGSATPCTISTSGFTKCTITATMPSFATLTSTGTIGFTFIYYRNSGAAEAVGDGVYLGRVMVNEGSVAAPFQLAGGNMQGEIAMAQRYYEKNYLLNVSPGTSYVVNTGPGLISVFGSSSVNDFAVSYFPFKVTKRIVPTMHFYSDVTGASANVRDCTAVADQSVVENATQIGIGSFHIYAPSGIVSTHRYSFFWTAEAEL